MTIDAPACRSRRAVLAGAVAGLAAIAVNAIARPEPVLGGVDGDVVLGADNTAASATRVTNSDSSGTGIGFVGQNSVGTGILGHGGSGSVPAGKPKTGVYGHAAQDVSSRGVWGFTTAGQGVRGEATTGIGVRAYSASGPAGSFETATGYAIQASGRLKLHKATGIAIIASGTRSVVVTPGVDVLSSSFVLATLNGSAGGTTTVQRVSIDATNDRFTIFLTANSTAAVRVAWMILG
jgi:hypothetical protein